MAMYKSQNSSSFTDRSQIIILHFEVSNGQYFLSHFPQLNFVIFHHFDGYFFFATKNLFFFWQRDLRLTAFYVWLFIKVHSRRQNPCVLLPQWKKALSIPWKFYLQTDFPESNINFSCNLSAFSLHSVEVKFPISFVLKIIIQLTQIYRQIALEFLPLRLKFFVNPTFLTDFSASVLDLPKFSSIHLMQPFWIWIKHYIFRNCENKFIFHKAN